MTGYGDYNKFGPQENQDCISSRCCSLNIFIPKSLLGGSAGSQEKKQSRTVAEVNDLGKHDCHSKRSDGFTDLAKPGMSEVE